MTKLKDLKKVVYECYNDEEIIEYYEHKLRLAVQEKNQDQINYCQAKLTEMKKKTKNEERKYDK